MQRHVYHIALHSMPAAFKMLIGIREPGYITDLQIHPTATALSK